MITVAYENGDRMRVGVRGHEVVVDQPVTEGGADAGPTPTELFVASLAACTAHYAQRFLRRHGLSTEGLRVSCDYSWAEHPHRVGSIDLVVTAPGLVEAKREAFSRVIDRCTVHTSITNAPTIHLRMSGWRTAAA